MLFTERTDNKSSDYMNIQGLILRDELDSEGDLELHTGEHESYIGKGDALKLIAHLTAVFNLEDDDK